MKLTQIRSMKTGYFRTVTNCRACPFSTCQLEATEQNPAECTIDGGVLPKRGTPRWCPLLRFGPITVRHKRAA